MGTDLSGVQVNLPAKQYVHSEPRVKSNTVSQKTLVFLDDNARLHADAIIQDAIKEGEINHLVLPLLFFDLNAIEHV